jgi:hypothetical protein
MVASQMQLKSSLRRYARLMAGCRVVQADTLREQSAEVRRDDRGSRLGRQPVTVIEREKTLCA